MRVKVTPDTRYEVVTRFPGNYHLLKEDDPLCTTLAVIAPSVAIGE